MWGALSSSPGKRYKQSDFSEQDHHWSSLDAVLRACLLIQENLSSGENTRKLCCVSELCCPLILHGSGAECPAVLGRCGQEKELPFNPTSALGLIFLPGRGRLLMFLKVFSCEVWLRSLSCLLPPVWRKLYPEPRTLDFWCCHTSSMTGWKCRDRDRPRRQVVAMVARAPQD